MRPCLEKTGNHDEVKDGRDRNVLVKKKVLALWTLPTTAALQTLEGKTTSINYTLTPFSKFH